MLRETQRPPGKVDTAKMPKQRQKLQTKRERKRLSLGSAFSPSPKRPGPSGKEQAGKGHYTISIHKDFFAQAMAGELPEDEIVHFEDGSYGPANGAWIARPVGSAEEGRAKIEELVRKEQSEIFQKTGRWIEPIRSPAGEAQN